MKLDFYSKTDLSRIIVRNASILDLEIEEDLIEAIALRSR
jgi:Holliday junction resolvasome RuvABC ATP-dependent DNA helicase subunit